jgi:hypothetical protein
MPVAVLAAFLSVRVLAQTSPYPHNAVACERCHNVPSKFGTSPMTVQRIGEWLDGKFIPATEGDIHHRNGESAESSASAKQLTADRISLNLSGRRLHRSHRQPRHRAKCSAATSSELGNCWRYSQRARAGNERVTTQNASRPIRMEEPAAGEKIFTQVGCAVCHVPT